MVKCIKIINTLDKISEISLGYFFKGVVKKYAVVTFSFRWGLYKLYSMLRIYAMQRGVFYYVLELSWNSHRNCQ